MSTFTPTDEQAQIVMAYRAGERLVIDAAAGSGKTSTLRLLAEASPHRRAAYLAYNRAIKEDAKRSFPGSVECMTSHGLAYAPVATKYKHRLNGGRLPAQRVAQILGIREPVRLAPDLAPLAPQQLARIAVATVARFAHTADDEVTGRHVPLIAGLELPAVRSELAQAILPYARKAWSDIVDPSGQLRFEHDHYLKIYQLARPKLAFDVLFVDEAQDLNPVVQAIVNDQTDAQVVLVGDRCQQLYAWRGAVDAMSTFDGRRLVLSQSFRFGDQIAAEANKWLAILRADLRVRGLPSIPSTVEPVDQPAAILCRTNGTALARVLDAHAAGRRAALVGRVGTDIAALARAARDLMQGRSCDHAELLAFGSWSEVRDFVQQDSSASDLKVFVDLIDKWGPDGVLAIVDRLVNEDRADVVISTAHAAKGREWASVQVATDFREPKPADDGSPGVIERPDAMLAYVTVTRAKRQLDRRGLEWVDRYVPGAAWRPAKPDETPGELTPEGVPPAPVDAGLPAHHERVGSYLLTCWCQRCQQPGESYEDCTCRLAPDRHVRRRHQDETDAQVEARLHAAMAEVSV